MPFCPKCGQQAAPDAAFCHGCGCNLKQAIAGSGDARQRPRQDHSNRAERNGGQPRAPQGPNEAGIAAHAALDAKRARKRLIWMIAIFGGVLLVIVGSMTYSHVQSNFVGAAIVIGIVSFLVGVIAIPGERISEAQYQSLPGVMSEQGHRCIFCGGRGIYRHTRYKTNNTLADCSRCKAELWVE